MFQQLISIAQKAAKAAAKTRQTVKQGRQAGETLKGGQITTKLMKMGAQVAIQSGLQAIFTALSALTSPLGAVLIMAGAGLLLIIGGLLALLILLVLISTVTKIPGSDSFAELTGNVYSAEGAYSGDLDSYTLIGQLDSKNFGIPAGSSHAVWTSGHVFWGRCGLGTSTECTNTHDSNKNIEAKMPGFDPPGDAVLGVRDYQKGVEGIDERLADFLALLADNGWKIEGGFGIVGHHWCVGNRLLDKKDSCSESQHIHGRAIDIQKITTPDGVTGWTCYSTKWDHDYDDGDDDATDHTADCQCTEEAYKGGTSLQDIRGWHTHELGTTKRICYEELQLNTGANRPRTVYYRFMYYLLTKVFPDSEGQKENIKINIGLPISIYHALRQDGIMNESNTGQGGNLCKPVAVFCFTDTDHNGHIHLAFCGPRWKYQNVGDPDDDSDAGTPNLDDVTKDDGETWKWRQPSNC